MIDDHAHPFPLAFEPLDPASITLDSATGPTADARRAEMAPGRLYLELLLGRLAGLLDCEVDEACHSRDEVAAADWPGWVRRLLDDAEVAGLVLDQAVGPDQVAPVEDWAQIAGRPMWELARIDPVVDSGLGTGAGARDVVQAVEAYMATAAERGCVAFKSILAYRTGLAVDPGADLVDAERSLRTDLPLRRRGKALRDLVLRRVLALAADLGRPVQVHTGYGDADIRLSESNPLLLEDLLRTPEGRAADVVLIHGAHPWHQEAAHLATTRPNVWLELSLSNLFAPMGVVDRLCTVIDQAPSGRLLVGSDGHGPPETHWFACRILLDAWSGVAERLTDAGARRSWVEEARRAIFSENASALYGLSGTLAAGRQ